MKKFFKCLFDGIWVTAVLVLISVIVWAFLTLTTVVVVGLSPIWFIILSVVAAKVSSFKDVATKTLDELERVLDNVK